MAHFDDDFDRHLNKMENRMGKLTGLAIGIWLLGLALTIGFWAFVIWAVIQVMQHFGVI